MAGGAEKVVSRFPKQDNMMTRQNDAKIKEHGRIISNHEERLVSLEHSRDTINDMADTVAKIAKYIKVWAPMVGTAAVTSGIVSGRWGAFLSALFHGG